MADNFVFIQVDEDPRMVSILADIMEERFSTALTVSVRNGSPGIEVPFDVVAQLLEFLINRPS